MSGLLILIIFLLVVAFFFWAAGGPSQPERVADPYDVDPSANDLIQDDFYDWLRYEATEEDLKELYGNPKPLTEKEKKWIDENSKYHADEPDDDLPF